MSRTLYYTIKDGNPVNDLLYETSMANADGQHKGWTWGSVPAPVNTLVAKGANVDKHISYQCSRTDNYKVIHITRQFIRDHLITWWELMAHQHRKPHPDRRCLEGARALPHSTVAGYKCDNMYCPGGEIEGIPWLTVTEDLKFEALAELQTSPDKVSLTVDPNWVMFIHTGDRDLLREDHTST